MTSPRFPTINTNSSSTPPPRTLQTIHLSSRPTCNTLHSSQDHTPSTQHTNRHVLVPEELHPPPSLPRLLPDHRPRAIRGARDPRLQGRHAEPVRAAHQLCAVAERELGRRRARRHERRARPHCALRPQGQPLPPFCRRRGRYAGSYQICPHWRLRQHPHLQRPSGDRHLAGNLVPRVPDESAREKGGGHHPGREGLTRRGKEQSIGLRIDKVNVA